MRKKMVNKPKKIIVLGGEGMLGHKMTQILRTQYPDTACSIKGSLAASFYKRIDLFSQGSVIEHMDAMDMDQFERTVKVGKWDIIINCIGVIKQRKEAANKLISITINSLLPHRLAALASEWGGRIIHFSTDCVFDGRRGRYTEDDPSNAEDLYGKSKFLGEVIDHRNALTLRTSIIGRELTDFRSLLEWFLSQNGKTVRGFRRHIFSGVSTNYLSRLVGQIIEQVPDLWGLYQIASDPISKYDLLCLLRDAYGLKITVVPDDLESCDRSLVSRKFIDKTALTSPPWRDLIEDLVRDKTPYEKWRG
jgi:dTDP-4-dehydrorhamnose reductase